MENLWERFDTIAKPEDVMEAKAQFTPVEEGEYEVTLEELIPSQSKNGLPMLKGKFRIIETNRLVFYNQMLQNVNYEWLTVRNIAEAVEFVSGIIGEEYEFEGLGKLATFISSIPTGTNHRVEVSYGDKDVDKKFTQLRIILPEDVTDDGDEEDNSDLPF